ncbi:hypothetical protein JXO52_01710 [bacterium]|nr:hypothetical protein [bacterium]
MRLNVLHLIFWLYIFAGTAARRPLYAQVSNDPFTIGHTDTLYSQRIGEERPVFFSLPVDYNQSGRSYPVLIILDGGQLLFRRAAGLVNYLSAWSDPRIPEMIVAGVPNTNRARDMNVFPLEQLPGSGDPEPFRHFITEELIPYIETKYRTSGCCILYGGSAAGQFALYTLMKTPASLDACIAASPGVSMGRGRLLQWMRDFLQTPEAAGKRVFVPYFEKDQAVVTDSMSIFEEILSMHAPAGFLWKTFLYPGKAHVPLTGLLEGLLWLFQDWKELPPPAIIPARGEFAAGTSLSIQVTGAAGSHVYRLGDRPEKNGFHPVMGPLHIDTETVLHAKSVRPGLDDSYSARAEYRRSEPWRSLRNPAALRPGLCCSYYERQWFALPDSFSITPVKQHVVATVDCTLREREQGFLLEFSGFLRIPTTGNYIFFLKAGSRSRMHLDGREILSVSGQAANQTLGCDSEEDSYALPLEKGIHRVVIQYTNPWNQDNILELSWEGPGFARRAFGPADLFHNAAKKPR